MEGTLEVELPVWTQYVDAVGPSAVALAVVYVAIRQWSTDRKRLKHDLFDRRWSIFDAAVEALGHATASGELTPAQLAAYLNGISGAQWLIDTKIDAHLRQDLYHFFNDLNASKGPNPQRHTQLMATLPGRYKTLTAMLDPYMKLSH